MLPDAELTPDERRLVETVGTGESFYGDRFYSGGETAIRAELIADLLSGRRATPSGYLRELAVVDVKITGALNLRSLVAPCPSTFLRCTFDTQVDLTRAHLPALTFDDCTLAGLLADDLRVDGTLWLGGSTSSGPIWMADARAGELWMRALRVNGSGDRSGEGVALNADGLTVDGGVRAEGLRTDGAVLLTGGRVGTSVDLRRAELSNPGGAALSAEWLSVGRAFDCTDARVAGGVRLGGAVAGDNVDLSDATVRNPGGLAVDADGARVGGELKLNGLTAVGGVKLSRVHVGGSVQLHDAHLSSNGGYALTAFLAEVSHDLAMSGTFVADGGVDVSDSTVGVDLIAGGRLYGRREFRAGEPVEVGDGLNAYGVKVARDLTLVRDLRVRGRVSMVNAVVGNAVRLDGVELRNPGGDACQAEGLDTSVLFARESLIEGDLVLIAAHVRGEMDARGTTLRSPGRHAVSARAMVVDGDLKLHGGFRADGRFRLPDVRVGGRLDLSDATLTDADHEVNLSGVRARTLDLRFAAPPPRSVDLTGTQVSWLVDDPASWPAELSMRGFSYDLNEAGGVSVEQRLGWVRRHRGGIYEPGPYDQLAAAYRHAGHVERARRVEIAKRKHRRSRLNPPGRAWNWFLYLTVGYGYRPGFAVVWLAALIAVGTGVFALARAVGSFHPAAGVVPAFNPLLYAIDVLLPVGDLGQQSGWIASGLASAGTVLLTLAGWLLATALVAGLTNVVRRE